MEKSLTIRTETISSMILNLRGEKVILDTDLALLYGVEVKRLKEAVRRNLKRFPQDFLFHLMPEEYSSLRTQFATLKRGQHSKYLPFAFTEQGVAMLSSVLNSDRAIQVNISIMRAFVQLRQFLETNRELALKLEELERTVSGHDENIQVIFETIRQLIGQNHVPREPVGFKIGG